MKKKSGKVVMVSGGFDPIHPGHVRYFQAAKKLGNKLVVVINNDHWIKLKKGKGFMSASDRAEVIRAFKDVDEVVISNHKKNTKDISVCKELTKIRPHIFANGGDRKPDGDPVPEVMVCKKLGVQMVYNVGEGGKIRSSSELLKAYSSKKKK
jgi:D-beta-D-heptose 7-phosphate kinase/D-beta-D-heptose 1-phosphate adenosyltransferase